MNTMNMKCQGKLFTTMAGMWLGLLVHAVAHADSAVAWGRNNYGQLGNGTSSSFSYSNVPVTVSGLSSGVTAVAAGSAHSLVIQNGAAKAWGFNGDGELGNGSTTNSNVFVVVNSLGSGITAVAGGDGHSLAIQNGAAKAWGSNIAGQLGNGSTTNSDVPVTVSGLTSGVTAVAAGSAHSLAIQNGAAKAWGFNGDGELGNGSTSITPPFGIKVPVAVSGLSSGVTAVAGGGLHSLAIQNGAAKAWGWNNYGQLGNGSNTDSNVPVAVSGLSSGVTAVAGGGLHSLAIRNGNVYAWGDNVYGELGNGSRTSSPVPVLALDIPAELVAVAAANYSSYALSSDGSLWVWGDNEYGQLGLGTTMSYYTTPQHLLPPSGYIFTSINTEAQGYHAVATLAASVPPLPCPADLNTDGVINTSDLAVLLRHFGENVSTGMPGDLNNDGVVNTVDLSQLLQVFGTACQ